MNFKERLVDAVSYWERRRLLYNGVLTILALVCWGPEIVAGGPGAWMGGGIVLLVFCAIANALFCLAYPVDLAIQVSPLKELLPGTRGVLFVFGLALASTIALWVLLGNGMA